MLATGCAQLVPQTVALRTDWPEGVPRTTEMNTVPFFPQDDYQCGPAALATILSYSGVDITPQALVDEVFLPSRKGTLQIEMLAAPRRHGRVSYALMPSYSDMLREVAAGNPVIVLQDVGDMFTEWHYAVVVGFDYPSGTIYLRSGDRRRREVPFSYFEREWIKGGYWGMVVTAPDKIAATATEERWVSAVVAMARSAPNEAAQAAYAAALARWPDNIAAAVGLANEYHASGAYQLAVQVLRIAQHRHPDSPIVINNLAQVLFDQGRYNEALVTIEKVSDKQGPFAADIRSTRAMIEERLAQQKTGRRP
ncbi:PA2778 family cysteine peptidase [Caenimonas koreensis DSM 17982]|uniref:PA2778 family cysteine peptidase n=1 Tax=Caenimonas koreensis DSM 17982 TaxID=1121255 RepID=A0A844B9A9_9BURK|nr:PA2778 family cysteine peptidase [Caenimonas koreensis]MRD49712.1 PA2778 family cysteine peptidase [Caenimonas koreensis DSM 17982]